MTNVNSNMQVLHDLSSTIHKNSAVSLGKFDALHKGHRLLIKSIAEAGEGRCPVLFTFGYNQGEKHVFTQAEKDMILSGLGIQKEVVCHFEDIRNMLPEEFVKDILMDMLHTTYISVGEDFCFGKRRRGDVVTLHELSGKYGYSLDIHKKLDSDYGIISSTLIKIKLDNGQITAVNELMGDRYFIIGKVMKGFKLGRNLGFATANIYPSEDKYLPCTGVYATQTHVGDRVYPSVTNIGTNPTVGGSGSIKVETHLIDFDEDLYGETIRVDFVYFIRHEKKFADVDKLKKQIEYDVEVRKSI